VTKPEEFATQSDIAALAIAEQRYRALVRATSSLVWVTAADGQIVDMPEWRAYTGEPVEQIKGWGWLNSLHPDDRERTAVVWQQAVDARSFYETDYRIRRNDGVYVWHRARGVPVLEADGSIREWVGICLDITQRRQAEEKRIEAETALRRLNETLEQRVQAETRERLQIWNVSQDLLVIVGLDGKYLSVNPAWTATLGWSEADLLGKSSQWLLHPDDRESGRAEFDHLAKGHKTLRFENRLRAKDGSYHWISWTASPDSGRIYCMGRDVTERKRAEAELRESEQNYRMLFESIDEGFCTIEVLFDQDEKPVDYRFLQVSPSFERQTGIKNAVGRRMREIAPRHEERWFEIYGKIALTGEPMRFENEAKQLGRWYDVYAFRIDDPKRRRVGILFNDITSRKRAEAEARDSERRYREVQAELAHAGRVAIMGQLTASIAHEVKQPITANVTHAYVALMWLDRQPPDLEGAREALACIINDGTRAGEVIDRIHDLVTKAPPRKDRLEINGAIREVIELTRGEAMKERVKVQMQLAEDLPLIEGDRVQLQQVILNLIINAIQAMSAVSDGTRQLLVSTGKEESGDVLVAVRDTGPGLPPGTLGHVIEAFYTTKSDGMGMGLSICRSIVEAHGGRIWANANEPRGALFQFTLAGKEEELMNSLPAARQTGAA
jgi:PAS domain S-box-containing protein